MNNYITNILENIILLQEKTSYNQSGCDRCFLGNQETTYNTRPINLYSNVTSTLWTMTYNYQGSTGSSSTFRIENLNNNIATMRILIANEDNTYTATDNFFLIDINRLSCIKCLNDTFVNIL